MRDFELVAPGSLLEACQLLKGSGGHAMAKAGGIDVLDLMKEGIAAPRSIVNLAGLCGLDRIEDDEGGLSIGALATLATIGDHAAVKEHAPILAAAAGDGATPQIRNMATIGGNLCQRPRCWYFRSSDFTCLKKGGPACLAIAGDNRHHAIFGQAPCPIVCPSTAATALVALGATLSVTGSDGERTLPVEDLYVMDDPRREISLLPDELIAAVRVPRPAPGTRSAFLRFREKDTFDWPQAEVAVAIAPHASGPIVDARVVLGAAAPIRGARAAEIKLVGKDTRITHEVARAAADAAVADARPLTGNGYKVELFRELVARALLEASAS
ncbi:MAG: FAD binding domain-containing protein [Acidobacteriota bacterium]